MDLHTQAKISSYKVKYEETEEEQNDLNIKKKVLSRNWALDSSQNATVQGG